MRHLFRGFLFISISFTVLGQVAPERYDALKQALGLTDSQVSQIKERRLWQLQAWRSPAREIAGQSRSTRPAGARQLGEADQAVPTLARPTSYRLYFRGRPDLLRQSVDSLRDQTLDDTQRAKVAEIEEVLSRQKAACQAIVLGLISREQWHGGPLCHCQLQTYASEFSPSGSQVRQLKELQRTAREPIHAQISERENHRSELLNSGIGADSPAVVRLASEIAELRGQFERTVPQRALVLAVLDDAQKAKLGALEATLELAREAIDLGLIVDNRGGEALCP